MEIGKRCYLKIKPHLYVLRLFSCFHVCYPNIEHKVSHHLGNLVVILSISASFLGIFRCACGHLQPVPFKKCIVYHVNMFNSNLIPYLVCKEALWVNKGREAGEKRKKKADP